MKLNKKSLLELLRIMECGGTAYQAKKKTGVSVGRVYQIWNEYRRTGRIPELGKNVGRPLRPIKDQLKRKRN